MSEPPAGAVGQGNGDLVAYLIRVVVDDDFRALALQSPDESFSGYDLADADMDVLRRQDSTVLDLLARATRQSLNIAEPAPAGGTLDAGEATEDETIEVGVSEDEATASEDEATAAEGEPPPAPGELPAVPPGAPLPEIAVMVRVNPYAEGTAGADLTMSYVAGLQSVPHPSLVDDVGLSPRGGQAEAWAVGAIPPGAVADVTIVGLGISAADHLTPAAVRALRAARRVLYLDTGIATSAVIEGLNPNAIPLFASSYVEDESRVATYESMAEAVVAAAREEPPVVFAIHGHPLVGVAAPFLVARAAQEHGLTVAVEAGISAMDCLFADLGVDPVVSGMQMYEATDLLLRRRPLRPDVPALIWQAGNLETRLHASRPSRPVRFERFCGHLRRFYPIGHLVTIYHASPHPVVPSTRIDVPLADLPSRAPDLHAGVTLYIPPAYDRPIVDAELARQVDDPAHLRRITLRR